jgi:hypothetical protein
MGRAGRVDVGGMVYRVLNRANFRSRLFRSPAHYQEFLSILEESLKFVPLRILACGSVLKYFYEAKMTRFVAPARQKVATLCPKRSANALPAKVIFLTY